MNVCVCVWSCGVNNNNVACKRKSWGRRIRQWGAPADWADQSSKLAQSSGLVLGSSFIRKYLSCLWGKHLKVDLGILKAPGFTRSIGPSRIYKTLKTRHIYLKIKSKYVTKICTSHNLDKQGGKLFHPLGSVASNRVLWSTRPNPSLCRPPRSNSACAVLALWSAWLGARCPSACRGHRPCGPSEKLKQMRLGNFVKQIYYEIRVVRKQDWGEPRKTQLNFISCANAEGPAYFACSRQSLYVHVVLTVR